MNLSSSTRHSSSPARSFLTRRQMFDRAAAGVAAGIAGAGPLTGTARATAGEPAVVNGRIKQSIVQWCFEVSEENWDLETTCQVAKELGCPSVELIRPEQFPILKKYGLTCAIVQIDMSPDPPFLKGYNNPEFWPRLNKTTLETIDAAAEFGAPSVICFTGYSAKDPDNPGGPHFSLEEGARNCVEGLKKEVVPHAEKKGVTLCLEMLNSRDDSHPMKGHPGYQGDHIDYCVDILKAVGSPRLKLLFDVYHAQIMDGDIIRRIREHKDYIGHVHTAGNPGRHELDDNQEIQYPPIMRALLETGYDGYVGQEFIPTRDARQGLREAVRLCDI